MSRFKKAVRSQRKARIALCGPTGSGKTYTALQIAKELGEPIALIDTERSSAALYSGLVSFDVLDLCIFSPQNYIQAIHEAADANYPVLVIDSFSHAWTGKEGILQQVDKIAARMKNPNSYTAWKEGTPMFQELIDTILDYPGHVIVTMRSKMDYAQDKNSDGRTVIKKLGMAPVQREGVEYEFDLVGDMDVDHQIVITKSRFAELSDHVERKPGKKFASTIKACLSEGEPEQPRHDLPPVDYLDKLRTRVLAGESKVYPTPAVVAKAREKYIGGKDPKDCPAEELNAYLAHITEKYREKQVSHEKH